MERLFILSFASGKPEAVFKMIDRALHGSPDLIGIIPFRGSPEGAGVCPISANLMKNYTKSEYFRRFIK